MNLNLVYVISVMRFCFGAIMLNAVSNFDLSFLLRCFHQSRYKLLLINQQEFSDFIA